MGNFEFIPCGGIEGLYEVVPKVYGDARGYFMETYQKEEFMKAGITPEFVQDNQSFSGQGVLRGLHFQKTHPQGKLVRALCGEVYDAVVDLREGSATYGKWFGIVLTEEKKNMLYVPPGFAHGYYVMSEQAVFSYKCTDYYHPEDEGGLMWNDPDIGVEWPLVEGVEVSLSAKDQCYPAFAENPVKF